jgi:hypothetical protein
MENRLDNHPQTSYNKYMKNSSEYNEQVLTAVEKVIKLLQDEFNSDPEIDPMLALTALITSYIEFGDMHGFELDFLRESVNKSLDNIEQMDAMDDLAESVPNKKEMLN